MIEMNANRRFLISFVAYLGYLVLLAAGLGLLNGFAGRNPALTGALAAWPLPALLWFFYHTSAWKKQVQRHGVLAPAQVLAVLAMRDTRIPGGGSGPASFRVDLAVRVMPDDEPGFEGEMDMVTSRMGMPSPGEMIMVRYDRGNRGRIAAAGALAGAATIAAPAVETSALDTRMRSTTISELANQLRALDEQHRAGSLSDQEFWTAKKRLLA
jgi:hypothetical protein